MLRKASATFVMVALILMAMVYVAPARAADKHKPAAVQTVDITQTSQPVTGRQFQVQRFAVTPVADSQNHNWLVSDRSTRADPLEANATRLRPTNVQTEPASSYPPAQANTYNGAPNSADRKPPESIARE